MINRFESRWLIAIIGEVYHLVCQETGHLYFSAREQISLYYKIKKKIIWFCKMFFLSFDGIEKIYKILWSANIFNRFYNKTVTTAEEHNIDLPVFPGYLRLQIKNGS